MAKAGADSQALLSALADGKVDFIVVGGVAAWLHGAPLQTIDLDLVYSRAADNLARLESALKKLEARYRVKPEVRPDARRLDGPGHHLLMTSFGPLDLLGSTVGGEGYQELIKHAEEMELGVGHAVRVLDLPTLIRIKETLASDRDLAVLPILRRTLSEKPPRNK